MTQRSPASVAIAALLAAVIFAGTAHAGAWVQEKKGYFLKVSTSYLFTRVEFNHLGDSQSIFEEDSTRIDTWFRDVSILAYHFLKGANGEYGKQVEFGIGSVELLEQYPWPGNIRQLENLVKRAVLLTPGPAIGRSLTEQILVEEGGIASPSDVPPTQSAGLPAAGSAAEGMRPYARVREDEVEKILEALTQQQGNKTRAAISLGLTPRQLRYRMVKLNISG